MRKMRVSKRISTAIFPDGRGRERPQRKQCMDLVGDVLFCLWAIKCDYDDDERKLRKNQSQGILTETPFNEYN